MEPRFLKGTYWPIIAVAMLLTAVGVLMIYSASFRLGGGFAFKQFVWALIALVVLLVTMQTGYRFFLDISYVFYGVTLALLAAVLFVGGTRFGANRWIQLGPFALQPSELSKLAAILALAQYLGDRSISIAQKRSFLTTGLIVMVPMLLIVKQPDLGSSLVFLPVLAVMLFLWGVRIRYLLTVFAAGLAVLPLAWQALKPYQQKRILVFFDPSIDPIGASYTAIQSKIAVGSGGMFGKGWLAGTQTQLDFVPEHHTDFIFCVIGEEFGFFGCFLVLALFALLISYAFHIFTHTTDLKARLLAGGIAMMLFFQVFVNIGMTIGVAPITGLTLPLVSYGGSSLVTTFFALGLLASIYRQRSIF